MVFSFGTFFGLFWFSDSSQTWKTYSFGHLSEKRQISKVSKSSSSKAGRFRRFRRHSKHIFRNNKGVFFWYIFLPLLVLGDFADIENVFLWASLSKMTDLEGFKAFCLKSWRVSQSSQGISDFVSKLPLEFEYRTTKMSSSPVFSQ